MRVTLQPSGAVLETLPGERILNAAQRLGYECPQSCRNGNCHVCAALLVEGQVEQAGEVRDHGEFYTCLAAPLEDCVVLWDGVLALGELPVRSLACQLIECVDMGGDVWRVRLRAPAGKPPRYHAGQYVMLERENGEKSAFSLASAPHSGRDLELHVLVREDSARSLIEQLADLAEVEMQLVQDAARMRRADQRRVCGSHAKLATATGWAPDITTQQSLRAILSDWEKRVRQE